MIIFETLQNGVKKSWILINDFNNILTFFLSGAMIFPSTCAKER